MTQRSKDMNMSSSKSGYKKCFQAEKNAIEIMIRGYQEMAEINLKISKLCFEVESEADDIYIRLTECE